MRAASPATSAQFVTDFIAHVSRASTESAARQAYREAFARLRRHVEMYPPAGYPPSVVFESAAGTIRTLAADCLPLGIAVAMHLYPLCVLQCMPLPLLSVARFQRATLLRTIRNRSLMLANAGSERSRGGAHAVIARRDADGIRIDGTFDYMSLASVADVVLFKAQLADSNSTVLCAAALHAETVRLGEWTFSGRMRLSDTSSVTFTCHHVPHGRYVLVADDDVLRCTSDYQRCWFHLFLAELYLARLERLHCLRGAPCSAERTLTLHELSRLREYALRLLDECSSGSSLDALKKTTSAMKLRVSLMAQEAMTAWRGREEASELCYIRSQPTADEIILRSIGASS